MTCRTAIPVPGGGYEIYRVGDVSRPATRVILMSDYILVVDGSADRRRVTRALLERAGYRVREVVGMDDAVQFARHEPPLVAVVEAPPGTGSAADFIGRIRRHPTTQDLPIIVLGCRPEDGSLADEPRSVSFLCEPCPPRSLLEEVAYRLRPRWGTAAPEPVRGRRPPASGAGDHRHPSASAAVNLADAFGYDRAEGQQAPV